MKKKLGWIIAIVAIVVVIAAVAGGGSNIEDQGKQEAAKTNLGKYSVTIDSCRLAKDYAGKDVVIIKYTFTNVSDENAVSFMVAMDDQVYQNGVGLNGAYIIDDNANYDSGNQMKEIKKGASIQLEVAYELNDTVSDVEVEVSELFSTNDSVVKKTFSIK